MAEAELRTIVYSKTAESMEVSKTNVETHLELVATASVEWGSERSDESPSVARSFLYIINLILSSCDIVTISVTYCT